MNKLIIISALVGWTFSSQVAANKFKGVERLVEYKCVVALQDGSNIVQNIRFKGERTKKAIIKQMGKSLKVPNKRDKQPIDKIHECVLLEEDFTNVTHRFLEKNQVK